MLVPLWFIFDFRNIVLSSLQILKTHTIPAGQLLLLSRLTAEEPGAQGDESLAEGGGADLRGVSPPSTTLCWGPSLRDSIHLLEGP